MKQPSLMSKPAICVEGALMMALAFILSSVPFIQLLWGGDITLFSTLPIVVFSLRHTTKYSLAVAGAYSLLQLMQGLPNVLAVPAQTLGYMVLCALLDYLLGYFALGFCGCIARRFSRPAAGIAAGIAAAGLLRLFFCFLSGLILWHQWAWEGWSVWAYSLAYNSAWCLPDTLIVLAAAVLLGRVPALGMLSPQNR